MKITFKAALDAASIIICDGLYAETYEGADGEPIQIVDQYDKDLIITVIDGAQEIEVDSDGNAEALNVDGEGVTFEFRVTRPLCRIDLSSMTKEIK